MSAVSLAWAGVTHGWFVRCAVCWCQMINGKKTASTETQTSMGASVSRRAWKLILTLIMSWDRHDCIVCVDPNLNPYVSSNLM